MKLKTILTLFITGIAALTFSSCTATTHAQHQGGVGAAIGGVAGGIMGHQSGKAGEGAALGGLIGGLIGHASGSEKDKAIGNQPVVYDDGYGPTR